jgi:aldehyde dehydrogenase (NAD+)
MVPMNEFTPITRPKFLDGKPKKLLIDGKWVDAQSGETFASYNPSTGEELDRVALAGEADVNLAVAAARRAFDEGPWSRFTPAERQNAILRLADLIDENHEELAMLDALDMGGPIAMQRYMKGLIVNTFRFVAGQTVAIEGETLSNSMPGEIFSFTLKQPVGVVGAIIPWNGPLFNATWKIAPVLASGCTMVLKCAEQASFSPLRLGELCLEAGIPAGVVNVITGFGEAGAALSSHPDVDKVAFTGSTETARHIIRASAGNIKKLTMELGGKSPNIILPDANLDEAVPGAAMAVFANSGQVCSAGSRLFVHSSIYDEFTQKVADFARTLTIGNSMDPNTMLGPLVSAEQLERVSGFLAAGANEGAKALSGGARLTDGDFAKGYFVPPTLFANVKDDMSIAREEIFGPVISAIRFDTLEEAVKRANNTVYGLGAGVWTRDVGNALQMAKHIRAGTVWVNCYQAMDVAVPFGGWKMSGYGLESGKHHIDEYLATKAVWIKTT